ncbi:cytochrome P450 [Kitasatospora sp. NPDC101155]|uniref:cytochrome P450 n=1 Tax=Kitasatospora sp. NPDC101155 TaxID=3364097 RepID=UPI0037FF5C81
MSDTADQLLAYPFKGEACPYDVASGYKQLQEKGPINRVTFLDGSEGWVVTGHEEARALLADPRISADRSNPNFPQTAKYAPGMPPVTTNDPMPREERTFSYMDGEEHSSQRRLVIPSFTVRQVKAMRPLMQQVADELIDKMVATGSPVDLISAYAAPFSPTMLTHILGIPEAEREFFQQRVQSLAAPMEHMMPALLDLAGYLPGLLEKKTAEPGQDLLSSLVSRSEDGTAELTPQNLLNTTMLVLISGNESSMTMISLGVLALLDNPEQLAAFRANPELAPSLVQELLRYLSVGGSALRVATEDIEIGDRLIRAGEGVVIGIKAANRDPKAFPDPEALDVRRGDNQHIAFSHGPHTCVAQNFATALLETAFTTLFARLPELRLAVPREELPVGGMGLWRVTELPVTW